MNLYGKWVFVFHTIVATLVFVTSYFLEFVHVCDDGPPSDGLYMKNFVMNDQTVLFLLRIAE